MHALIDEDKLAIASLQEAIDRGLFMSKPAAEEYPALEFIDDPALLELDERMRGMLNSQRQIAGLPPLDENYTPVVAE